MLTRLWFPEIKKKKKKTLSKLHSRATRFLTRLFSCSRVYVHQHGNMHHCILADSLI